MKRTEARRASDRKYYQKHKEEIRVKHKLHRQEQREYYRAYSQNYYQQARLEVFSHYSNGTLKCANCGETDIIVLCLDHINGGGNQHRRALNLPGGITFYAYLKRQNFPEGYQVLCWNCNVRKQHKRKENGGRRINYGNTTVCRNGTSWLL